MGKIEGGTFEVGYCAPIGTIGSHRFGESWQDAGTRIGLFRRQKHYWTDSKVVFGYINNEARRFHIFVANRVQAIRENSEVRMWKFVDTDNNPADDASRDIDLASASADQRWFEGPKFLWKS